MDNSYAANANVVLNADVSGYQNSLQGATRDTNKFLDLVNQVAGKLDGMSKRVGKRITIFSAADLAAMTGFAMVAANYEKQLKSIDVTLGRGQDSIGKYSKGINELARNFSNSRTEIVALTAQIRQLGISSQAENQKLASTFINLAKATNSSLPAVTGQMVEFSRQMGTMGSTGAGSMQKLSDSLVTVSQSTGTSAEGILNFSQAIAPISKVAGLTSKDVLGISAAFNRAGADGFTAGNTFNSMVADIARSTRTGSPELLKYANVVGKTMDEFKKLDPAEQIVQIFEAINKAGPNAVNMLDQLGFDGIRAAKSIQAVASEAGGLRAAVEDANKGYGSGATQEAADRGQNFQDAMSKAKNSVEQLSSAIGEGALPPLTALVALAGQLGQKMVPVIEPFAKIAGFIGTIVGGMGMVAGPLISQLSMFSKVGLAAVAYRGIKNSNFVAGINDARTGNLSGKGEDYKEGKGNFFQRSGYQMGSAIGDRTGGEKSNTLGRIAGAVGGAPFKAASWYGMWGKGFYQDAGGWGKPDPSKTPGTFTSDSKAYLANIKERASNAHASGKAAMDHAPVGMSGAGKAILYNEAFAKSMQRSSQSALATSSALLKFQGQVIGATSSLAKMSGMNIAQGTKNIATAGGSLLARGASSALGMVGGPAGAAVMGGMAAYSTYKSTMEDRDAALTKTEATTARYDAALGTATSSVTTFSDSLKRASATADSQNKTTAQILSGVITNKDKSDANSKEYADSNVSSLTSKQGAVGYLQSLGTLDTAHATAVRQDYIKRFGPGAQEIFDQYNKSNSSDNQQYNGASQNLALEAGLQQNQQLFSGNPIESAQAAFLTPGTAGNNSLNQSWMAAQQKASSIANKYNEDVGGHAITAGIVDYASGAANTANQFGPSIFNEKGAYSGAAAATLEKNMPGLFGDGKGKELIDSFIDSNGDTTKAVNAFLEKEKDSPNIGQYQKLFEGVTNDYQARLAAEQNPDNLAPDVKAQMGTATGKIVYGDDRIKQATIAGGSKVGDTAEFTKAVGETVGKELAANKGDVSKSVTDAIAFSAGKSDEDQSTKTSQAIIVELQKVLQGRAPEQSRNQNWSDQIGMAKGLAADTGPGAVSEGNRQHATDMNRQTKAEQDQFLLSMLQAERAFDIASKRQDEDYKQQMQYSNEDFNRSREEAQTDFLKSRNRQQEDYDKAMKRQIEDSAKTMYDPYSIMQAEYTTDTQTLLDNLKEQQEAILRQVSNLAKAKKKGLSNSAIDLLSLADPSKAQQLDRMMEDFNTDPSMIAKLNKASKGRVNATGKLVKNDANVNYRRQAEDFKKSMNRTQQDFDTSMNRSAAAFERSMARSDKARALGKKRMQEDFAETYKQLNDTTENMYKKSVDWVTKKLGPGMKNGLLSQLGQMRDQAKDLWKDIIPPNFTVTLVGVGGNAGGSAGVGGNAGGSSAKNTPKGNQGRIPYPRRNNAEGSIATHAINTNIAEQGPEAVIPLNTRGESFMANMMKRATAEVVKGMVTNGHRSPIGGGGDTVITTQNSYFTVDKVVAQDPNEMARKMKEKERLQALRRPVNKK